MIGKWFNRMVECGLQCGRIYKDAEIRWAITIAEMEGLPFNVAASIKMRKSQHIYARIVKLAPLQCGRIYKDAEICETLRILRLETPTFNVAASIKMRKSYGMPLTDMELDSLQCRRIYKDAEINVSAQDEWADEIPSMWPHL